MADRPLLLYSFPALVYYSDHKAILKARDAKHAAETAELRATLDETRHALQDREALIASVTNQLVERIRIEAELRHNLEAIVHSLGRAS